MTHKQAAALHNFEFCLSNGLYTAARSWWLEFVALGGLK